MRTEQRDRDLEVNLKVIADERALHRLVLRYATSCDNRDGDAFAALFAPDAVLEGPGFRFASPERIHEVPRHLARFHKTYHTVLNFVASVAGDGAHGETYSMAHHLTPRADGRYDDLVMYITYRDRYARLNGEWQFEQRTVVMEFTETRIVDNVGTMPKL